MSEAHEERMNRREFVGRALKAGASVATACSLGYAFYDAQGPDGKRSEKLVSLPDFSIPEAKGKMSVVLGKDRVKALERGLMALGGIEGFIKKGDRVLIKVNAAFATPPMLCATTNPQLLARMIELCYKAGAASVLVTDNPINDPATCFAMSGIAEATSSVGGKLLLPKETFFKPTTVGRLIKKWPLLYEPFQGVNKVIGMAPVKDHYRSGASMSMKNWYGLLGGRRSVFHQDIHNTIQELSMMVTPTLVILDGVQTMISNGPTGGSLSDLKSTHTMILSTDQVAADALGCTLLEKSKESLPYIAKAEAQGAGTSDYESLKPVRIELGE